MLFENNISVYVNKKASKSDLHFAIYTLFVNLLALLNNSFDVFKTFDFCVSFDNTPILIAKHFANTITTEFYLAPYFPDDNEEDNFIFACDNFLDCSHSDLENIFEILFDEIKDFPSKEKQIKITLTVKSKSF